MLQAAEARLGQSKAFASFKQQYDRSKATVTRTDYEVGLPGHCCSQERLLALPSALHLFAEHQGTGFVKSGPVHRRKALLPAGLWGNLPCLACLSWCQENRPGELSSVSCMSACSDAWQSQWRSVLLQLALALCRWTTLSSKTSCLVWAPSLTVSLAPMEAAAFRRVARLTWTPLTLAGDAYLHPLTLRTPRKL